MAQQNQGGEQNNESKKSYGFKKRYNEYHGKRSGDIAERDLF